VGRRASVYGAQLREKQNAKRYYGVRERQVRRYFRLALTQRDLVVRHALLVILE
jgi:small subunit ribosomal protein S4